MTNTTEEMETLVKQIEEEEGGQYGMTLSKDKCETLAGEVQETIIFMNGDEVKRNKTEVKYLGRIINHNVNINKERKQTHVRSIYYMEEAWNILEAKQRHHKENTNSI